MATHIDAKLARFNEVLSRLPGADPAGRAAYTRRLRRGASRLARRTRRAVVTGALLVLALVLWGLLVSHLGPAVTVLAVILLPLIMLAAFLLPVGDAVPPSPAQLKTAPAAVLPQRTEAWLDARRPDLPRLAAPQLDAIAHQLAALGPQLAAVPADNPTVQDLSRLLNTHLPELVELYTQVPPDQRARGELGAPSVDRQFVDGLSAISGELRRAADTMAADRRDAFAVQGKFIEDRYNPGS